MTTPATSSYDALIAAAVRANTPVTLSTGTEILIRGLTVMQFVMVVRDYPKVRDVILGAVGAGDEIEDSAMLADVLSAFVDSGPEAIAALVAASIGIKEKAGIDAVLGLSDDDFFKLLDRALELTMPSGVADFFGRLGAVFWRLGLSAPSPSVEAV